ncbi:SPOR domain-containing protein [Rhodobacteraceae bacterium]|nr:SPOR domain-containing protein [Paracoccaceae bacterium]
MLEGSEAALAGEVKEVNFKINMIFYWTGAALSLFLLAGAMGWSYQLIVRDVNQIPIVRAQLGPLRVAPDNPGGLTAANQGLSVTQLAVNEKPLLSNEIYLAPAAEILNEENLALKVTEEDESNKVDGAFEIKEINAENSMNLEALLDQKEVDSRSNDVGVLSKVAFSQKKIEIENAVSLALSITIDPDKSLSWLRPKIRPVGFYRNGNITEDQIVSNVPMPKLPIGSALVQLGAFDSKSLAESEWQRFEKILGSILIPKKMVIQKAESGGKIFYRLRASGFSDISDARQFCTAIGDKVACIPVVTR